MSQGSRRLAIALAAVAVLLVAYVAAGPYLAIRGIRAALADQDMPALQRHVDFPALRRNLKAHLEDALARRAGAEADAGGLLGLFGRQLAQAVGGVAVDALVTPAGIAGLLQGRAIWKRATGQTVDGDAYGDPQPPDPLQGAALRYESASRFTATARAADGTPVVAEFRREGLRWRLVDIRQDAGPPTD